jgi:predicted RNase H-like HicB family nuclease
MRPRTSAQVFFAPSSAISNRASGRDGFGGTEADERVKTMARARTYTVSYDRDEKGLWVAHVKGIAGCHTQGRTIAQARARIREALSLFDESADAARLKDDVRLPSDVDRLVSAQRSARWKREAIEVELRSLNVKAAVALTKRVGLSLRDAGELLGASQESVRQWVEA